MISTLLQSIKASNGFDAKRNYVGLSSIADSVDDLLQKFNSPPQSQDNESALKTWVSYGAEALLIQQIINIGGKGGVEISLFDGIIKGHTDASYKDVLVEIKSVATSDHFPKDRLPRRVFWQVQGYLKYLPQFRSCEVIYIARDSGRLFSTSVNRVASIQMEIENKIDAIVSSLVTK